MTRRLALGISISPTWLRAERWRSADSRVEELFELAPFADLARDAEAAGFDVVFAPDAGHLDPDVLDRSPGFSTLDSHTLVSALAAVTQRIGLVPTVQTTFASPYDTARRIMSLHRISGGRAGWNAVTSLGGHENHGIAAPPASEERYDRARRFVETVHALWDSYPAGAIVADRASGRFAHGVGRADAHGVVGPLPVEAHASGHPPLFQAGGSPAGVAFAGSAADAVFGMAGDLDAALAQRSALRAAADRAGRDPDAVRFLPGLSVGGAGGAHWTLDGDGAAIADGIARFADAGAIDGFIALPASWTAMRMLVDEVAPRLAERGMAWGASGPRTLRGRLGMDTAAPH